ncbi:MAG TPA: sigma-E factor regulatory protein RseB domain-containing protein [Fimbriimonadaceae bacterium]|nr:sigma-E factor regulatory protein RseB domain-containing protein [Fimbriimonadaceae bacterium]HRJ97302.1 sigma-E factor regulatory protein RseB domain-containing protein [Fimbriimonadaceae bacterium]
MFRAADRRRVFRLAPGFARSTAARSTAVVLGLLFAAFGATQNREDIREVFFRSIQKSGTVNATLVQTKRLHDGGRSVVKYSVTMDDKGRSRRTVLQPISMEGTIWIDDGMQWATIDSEEREIVIQPSPLKDRIDPKLRMKMIAANYELKSDGEDRIAGRKSLMIRAIPKERFLPERRYGIDLGNHMLLRIEVADSSHRLDVVLNTIAADFPKRIDPGLFTWPTNGYKVTRTDFPKAIRSIGSAMDTLGFSPRMPARLPYGFQVTQRHLVGGPEGQFLALRLSDGLAMMTVYQWDAARRYRDLPFKAPGDGQVGNVCIKVVGDVPSSIRRRLAESFLDPTADAGLDGPIVIEEIEGIADSPPARPPKNEGRTNCSDEPREATGSLANGLTRALDVLRNMGIEADMRYEDVGAGPFVGRYRRPE